MPKHWSVRMTFEAAEQVVNLAISAGMRGYFAECFANAVLVEGLTANLNQPE